MKKDKYLIPERLSDVIRLIVVLARDKSNFRTEIGLRETLRDDPKSSTTWLKVAIDHSEFFRLNKEKDAVILLHRFIQKANVKDGELREPLDVDQTQKLVDQAISLHDKQLARYQMDSSKTAIHAAYIATFGTILSAVISYQIAVANQKDLNTELRILTNKLDGIKGIIQYSQKISDIKSYPNVMDSVKTKPRDGNMDHKTGRGKKN